MARKSGAKKRRRKGKKRAPGKAQPRDRETPSLEDPWLSRRTGLRVVTVLSLGLAAFIAWQLQPTEGLVGALLWGLVFGGSIWVVFVLSYAFNTWARRRRRDD
ncbi:MAG: hypothetical protein R3272_05255 [Candidatus Promineifilaceae bacterium]|nr:hypothetical protein [Candidatus Promineifilaceae bacterium]